jgi:hypothetical protein
MLEGEIIPHYPSTRANCEKQRLEGAEVLAEEELLDEAHALALRAVLNRVARGLLAAECRLEVFLRWARE